MALDLYRTDRVERDYTVTVKDENGAPVTITSVQVALLPPRAAPTAATTWATKTVTAGVTTLVYAGPDATPQAGDLTPTTTGADVFFNDVNGDFRKATRIERINVVI